MRLLLLRPDKAGDALKTLPVLRALKAARPGDEIHVLASPHNASLFACEPGIRLHGEEKSIAGLNFDRAVSLLCDPFPEVNALLDRVDARERFRGHEVLKEGPVGRDETENIARIVERSLGVELAPGDFSGAPVLSAADEAEARDALGDRPGRGIGVCPFAGLRHRSHSLARWEKLVRRVAADDDWDAVVLFGTRADGPLLETWKRAAGDRVRVCHPSSFRAMGAYFLRLQGIVAVDSGPLHLARALGVPSLGLLSGGDARRWFPRPGPRDRLLSRGLLDQFPSYWEMGWAYRRWKAIQP